MAHPRVAFVGVTQLHTVMETALAGVLIYTGANAGAVCPLAALIDIGKG